MLVGPVGVGSYKFVFQADPPDVSKIPQSDILGVTVLLLTCSYNDTEFIRVGYYVNNEYADEELREEPPANARLDRVLRNILAEKPRVTRFPCEFDAQTIPVADGAAMGEEEETENQIPPGAGGGMGLGGTGYGEAECAPPGAEAAGGRRRARDSAPAESPRATASPRCSTERRSGRDAAKTRERAGEDRVAKRIKACRVPSRNAFSFSSS